MKRHAPAALAARLFALCRASSLAVLVLAGCSSRSAVDAAPIAEASIAECDAYLAALATCHTRAGSQVAEEMGASRNTLATRLGAAAT